MAVIKMAGARPLIMNTNKTKKSGDLVTLLFWKSLHRNSNESPLASYALPLTRVYLVGLTVHTGGGFG